MIDYNSMKLTDIRRLCKVRGFDPSGLDQRDMVDILEQDDEERQVSEYDKLFDRLNAENPDLSETEILERYQDELHAAADQSD